MYEKRGDPMCPVNLYKEFTRHRSSEMLEPDNRFNLSIKQNAADDIWYKQPMGKNSLKKIVRNMTHAAGITDRRLTNHSVRKTTVTNLLEAGFEPNEVMQITRHKNVQSITNYSHLQIKKQKEMSKVLSGVTANTATNDNQEPCDSMDDSCDEVQLIETSAHVNTAEQQQSVSVVDLPITMTSNG